MLITQTRWVDDAGVTTETPEAQPDGLQKKMAEEFRFQSAGCAEIGSKVYADLCLVCADDIERSGPVWAAMADHAHLRFGLALPLRFLAAVHRLALHGDAPQLAAHYVSCGGSPTPSLAADFLAAVDAHRRRIESELDWGVQTNEVVRTAALYPGLAHITALTGHPLSLREIGTSAGLNLRLDHFHYAQGTWSAGDPAGAVDIVDRWGEQTPSTTQVRIIDRAGCDPSPIDSTTPQGAIHLLGFLWPDQEDRRTRTLGAIETAKRVPARIEAMAAEAWLLHELASRTSGATTVIMHSIVWQYIDRDERLRITELVESVGLSATVDAPLAWLSFEPHEPHRKHAALTLRLWDGERHAGEPTHLAESGFHGQWVRWLAGG